MDNLREQIENCCEISLYIVSGVNDQELESACRQVYDTSQALKQFLDGQLSEDEFLDIVEFNEQNMDDYIYVVNQNLDFLGI